MNLRGSDHDESPNDHVPLEWWFVQGYWDGPTGRRHFMTSFFRHGFKGESGESKDGYSYLCSTLDPASGDQKTATRIDRFFFDATLARNQARSSYNIDQSLVQALVEELTLNGPFINIDLVPEGAEVRSGPLGIAWGDYGLEQGPDGWRLRFKEPGSGLSGEYKLIPESAALEIDVSRHLKGPDQGMFYKCYPRLRLTGEFGGAAVTGTAWLDHQWGDHAFLVAGEGSKRVLGWDWLGINFDDGEDWVAFVLRDVQKGEIVSKYVSTRDAQGNVRNHTEFDLVILKTWESPATSISYPVECRLDIPGIGASITFTPLALNQEIAVFGLTRAVWEGAGVVEGRIGGRAVHGRARGEFNGYGYIFDIKEFLKTAAERVDRQIEGFLPKAFDGPGVEKFIGPPRWAYVPSAYTEMLSRPLWDLFSRGGKRWRPLFAIFLMDALGKAPQPFEQLVCSLAELCHTGALIIDDIEDQSAVRRGGESAHIRYGLETAINAANTVYFLPALLIKNHPGLSDRQKLDVHEIYIRQMVRAHFGQALDLYWSRNMSPDNLRAWAGEDLAGRILQMYELKTAAPIEAIAEVVAVVAEADPASRAACLEFASALGVGFQILDDIHNYSESPDWKKTSGEDISEGKMTYILCRAMGLLPPGDRARIEAVVGSADRRKDPQEIRRATALVRGSGAIEACRTMAEDMIHGQWDNVRRFLKPSEPKIMFQLLYRALMDLRFE
jgi:geranylgeranyl diphosphate synthase type I